MTSFLPAPKNRTLRHLRPGTLEDERLMAIGVAGIVLRITGTETTQS
jgi:hypothetical protein